MGGKKKVTETSRQSQNYQNQENINTGPWGPQQPYIQQMFGEAQRLYNQGPQQYFPGQTYVDPSAYTLQGIQQLANLPGVQSDPLYGLASGFIGNSLNSVPQVGHIQDYLAAQLDPNTQMRAPVPGYAQTKPMPMGPQNPYDWKTSGGYAAPPQSAPFNDALAALGGGPQDQMMRQLQAAQMGPQQPMFGIPGMPMSQAANPRMMLPQGPLGQAGKLPRPTPGARGKGGASNLGNTIKLKIPKGGKTSRVGIRR